MKVEILNPKAYCSGVVNAIFVARKAKKENPNKRVIVLGMLVHNDHVINELNKEGIETFYSPNKTLYDLLKSVPDGNVVVFSAHGHDHKLDEIAKQKNLIVYDAVCFKVQRNFNKIKEELGNGHQVIFIGKMNHPEANAALALGDNVSLYDTQLLINYQKITDTNPYVVNQTTLNFMHLIAIHEDILAHFPNARIENEICDTTRLRQQAIANLEESVDLIIVVGDEYSSNSTRLLEIALETHPEITSIMVSSFEDIDESVIKNKNHIVISSGASTPPDVIDMIYQFVLNNA